MIWIGCIIWVPAEEFQKISGDFQFVISNTWALLIAGPCLSFVSLSSICPVAIFCILKYLFFLLNFFFLLRALSALLPSFLLFFMLPLVYLEKNSQPIGKLFDTLLKSFYVHLLLSSKATLFQGSQQPLAELFHQKLENRALLWSDRHLVF